MNITTTPINYSELRSAELENMLNFISLQRVEIGDQLSELRTKLGAELYTQTTSFGKLFERLEILDAIEQTLKNDPYLNR